MSNKIKLKKDDSLFMINDFISDGVFLIKKYLLDSFPKDLPIRHYHNPYTNNIECESVYPTIDLISYDLYKNEYFRKFSNGVMVNEKYYQLFVVNRYEYIWGYNKQNKSIIINNLNNELVGAIAIFVKKV